MHFRRRLLLAAFVGGSATALTVLAMVLAATLIVLRFTEIAVPLGTGLVAACSLAVGVVGAALAFGALRAGRLRRSDRATAQRLVAEHLEQRLATGGLLLAAADGAQLDPVWQRRLADRLAAVRTVLPTIRWGRLSARPAVALALLTVVLLLPPPAPATAPGAATMAAVERLAEQVEAVVALPDMPAEPAAELRAAVSDLERRAAVGETDLWRQIDQLNARLERERHGASEGRGGAADGATGGVAAMAAGPAPSAGELAAALQQLAAIDSLDGALAKLPEHVRQQVEAARTADGQFAPDALPAADEALRQIGAALGEHAGQLVADRDGLAELAAELQQQPVGAESGERPAELAQQLAAMAEQFAAPEREALAEQVAQAAADMAALGGLEQLPELPAVLRDAMLQAAAFTAESALQAIDLEQLQALLPDDLSQLRGLAESLAAAAEQMAGSSKPGESSAAPPSLPELSDAAKAKLAELARGLSERLAGLSMPGRDGGGDFPGSDFPDSGFSDSDFPDSDAAAGAGATGTGSEALGDRASGPGHAALRLTEHTVGGVGDAELPLPRTAVDPSQPLPDEWLPVATEKAEPEVSVVRDRRADALKAGPAAVGTGTATWQLRLWPRHREVVRRFFAGSTPGQQTTGEQTVGKDGK